MKDEKEDNLAKELSALSANKEYQNPKISPEGYGSFIPAPGGILESLQQRAKLLRAEAETINTQECVPLYLDALFYTLRAQAHQNKNSIGEYLNSLKSVIKLSEIVYFQARKHGCEKVGDAMCWALFNIKLAKLIKESALLKKDPDAGTYAYIIDLLRGFNTYYDSKQGETIELVAVEDIEDGIKRRI